MPEIVIERMKIEDLDQVLAIENVSFPTPFTENLFRMELKLQLAQIYVARGEGKVVGYIDYWNVGHEAHVITIAVHPEWRKKRNHSDNFLHLIY